MNASERRGDTGLSTFPPAEGERSGLIGAPAASADSGTGGSSVRPPATAPETGERSGAIGPGSNAGARWRIIPAEPSLALPLCEIDPLLWWNPSGLFSVESLGAAITGLQCFTAVAREAGTRDDDRLLDSVAVRDHPATTLKGDRSADKAVRRRCCLFTASAGATGAGPAANLRYRRWAGAHLPATTRYRSEPLPSRRGGRTAPSAAEAAATGALEAKEATWYSAHAQATVVTQVHNVFPSPYIGPRSLLPVEPAANTMTGTVFFAARIFESERNDTQVIFNPEAAGGSGFSGTNGIAGFPNGEATRVGVENPTPYIARLYVRQTFGFGGEREWAPDENNQVGGERDVRRLSVIVGKLAAPDIADDNRYSHDPRTQFLNWALVYNGAWDYPANVRGYTYGVALDYNHSKNLSFSYGVFTEPAVANGAALDWNVLKAQGQVLEMENRYELNERPGAVRLLAFLNHAHMGNYDEAVQWMPVDPVIAKTRSYRYKYGFGLNIDQALSDDVGFFSRLGWNDGHSESWAFTEIDQTATAGFVIGGRRWCRPDDRIGIAGVLNGISGPHQRYLEAGGIGFIIGDGRLKYGLEQILEMYYAWHVTSGIVVTLDFQEIANPGYNTERRPVEVGSVRVHWDH